MDHRVQGLRFILGLGEEEKGLRGRMRGIRYARRAGREHSNEQKGEESFRAHVRILQGQKDRFIDVLVHEAFIFSPWIFGIVP